MEAQGYLNRTNMEYIDQLYSQYQDSPDNVEPQWKMFFEGMEFGQNTSPSSQLSEKELDVYHLIRRYRDYGHLKANIDPLNLTEKITEMFDLKNFNLSKDDLNQKFKAGQFINKPNASLKEIIEFLEKTYCGTLTTQIAECTPDVRKWILEEFEEHADRFTLNKQDKKRIYEQLARTESLEKFIHTRYVGAKRFSVEGADAIIPMLEHMAWKGTELSVEEIVIGMAHRGRINVLANFMGKSLDTILAEFEGHSPEEKNFEGDVKYHIGCSADKQTPSGNCHISLAFNPSHLEAVNPVVLGMTRAKQRVRQDTKNRKKVAPVLLHGDAAFAGQGVVTETFQLSQLKGYTVGGTVHVILNNQIGFTTNPEDSRSTRYSSDTAMVIKAPVLIVNGDDIEACVRAMDIAIRFRQEFAQDVVIDLICYRRFGHNEGDEPAFTQPLMYKKIKKHPTPRVIYLDQLDKQGSLTKKEGEDFYQQKIDNLQKALDEVRATPPKMKVDAFGGVWKGYRRGTMQDFESPTDTTIEISKLQPVIDLLTSEPKDFNLNSKVKRLIAQRKKMIDESNIDWGMAELLSYGSIIQDGYSVRLSGQDCKRGTFTHRHAVYFDQETNKEYTALKKIKPGKEFCIYNSNLSEMAVLGFEYGNSSSDPSFLTIWEAQFGDFANGAQIIIDQFITSAEVKWGRMSGLTMLLPHGYEGQGPEHSSARLERFLQLCAQENIQVCNLTTPANLFHAFRRQMLRDFRKPLVIMSPKSLLRHPKVVSTMDDLTQGGFKEVLEDPMLNNPEKVETLVLCSGKVYYDLQAAREEKGSTDKLSIVRLEQLYPFPNAQLAPFLNGFGKLKRIVWCQEEPENMGALFFIRPQIERLIEDLGLKKVEYKAVSRKASASPATGSNFRHKQEQQELIDQILKYL